MNKKIIVIISIIIIILLIIFICIRTNSSVNADDTYVVNLNGDNSIDVPANESKSIFFKVNNTSDEDTTYKVGYISDSVKVIYNDNNSDDIEGIIEKDSIKYVRLILENTGNKDATITLYSVLENSDTVLPNDIKIVTKE